MSNIPVSWESTIAYTVAAARGDQSAKWLLERTFSVFDEFPEGADLAAALRRILAGERSEEILIGLHPVNARTVAEILRRLEIIEQNPRRQRG